VTDVLVVGGGPVGLMTALGLARVGVDVTVIEAEDSIVYSPRAISYAWTILPALEYFGVLDDMMAAGHTTMERRFRIYKTGETIIYTQDVLKRVTDRPYNLTLGQDLLAGVLLTHLMRYPNATVRWGTKFAGMVQAPDGVTVTAETADGPIELRASWVVGADGGRSQVRRAAGLSLAGFTWPQRFVVTNIYFDFEKHGWNSGYLIDRKYGAIVFKINQEGLWRFTFSEDATLPVETVLDRIPEFIDTVLPGDKKYELALHTAYNMHQRTAETYRVGRVLLAGDAAHVTNPTSGFGLMGGLNDAFALSEALAAVVQGRADDALLDRYSEARRKVFDQVTSPVSTASFKLVFEMDDAATMARILQDVRDRKNNPQALLKMYAVPAALETPSLLTGETFTQRLRK
jgi:3-(3-hydroxy-phenyl)propionate hydroxylase/6-hydroxy-3-succinoylpyridine 3-monooxygenase